MLGGGGLWIGLGILVLSGEAGMVLVMYGSWGVRREVWREILVLQMGSESGF